MKLPLSRVADFMSAGGEFDRQAIAQSYSIDSRTILPGELFFAVKGEKMDGHDFVQQAFEKGAVGAVVASENVSGLLSRLAPDPSAAPRAGSVRGARAWTPAATSSEPALIPVEDTL